MSAWGQKVDRWIDVAADRIGDKSDRGPGWRPIPGRPGLEGYWDGQQWDQRAGWRHEPEPMWKRTWPVFAGVVGAMIMLAILF